MTGNTTLTRNVTCMPKDIGILFSRLTMPVKGRREVFMAPSRDDAISLSLPTLDVVFAIDYRISKRMQCRDAGARARQEEKCEGVEEAERAFLDVCCSPLSFFFLCAVYVYVSVQCLSTCPCDGVGLLSCAPCCGCSHLKRYDVVLIPSVPTSPLTAKSSRVNTNRSKRAA